MADGPCRVFRLLPHSGDKPPPDPDNQYRDLSCVDLSGVTVSPRHDHRGPAVAFAVLFLVAVLVMGDQLLARAVGGPRYLAFDRAPRVVLAARHDAVSVVHPGPDGAASRTVARPGGPALVGPALVGPAPVGPAPVRRPARPAPHRGERLVGTPQAPHRQRAVPAPRAVHPAARPWGGGRPASAHPAPHPPHPAHPASARPASAPVAARRHADQLSGDHAAHRRLRRPRAGGPGVGRPGAGGQGWRRR